MGQTERKILFHFVEYVRPENTNYIFASGNSKQRRKAIRQARRLFPNQLVALETY